MNSSNASSCSEEDQPPVFLNPLTSFYATVFLTLLPCPSRQKRTSKNPTSKTFSTRFPLWFSDSTHTHTHTHISRFSHYNSITCWLKIIPERKQDPLNIPVADHQPIHKPEQSSPFRTLCMAFVLLLLCASTTFGQESSYDTRHNLLVDHRHKHWDTDLRYIILISHSGQKCLH